MSVPTSTTKTKTMTNTFLVAMEGQILFDIRDVTSIYKLISGEILIMRDGKMVDLVQPGELLDAAIWSGATAIALTHSVLQPIDQNPQMGLAFTLPVNADDHLHQSELVLN